ncbi:hypothetical protein ACH5RR_019671 [Cinchona calisaya]|uniref:Uncharacterized protein n=1 Tax=Cinchona calisaya TaxID=153742 RepID=A0ABD2ZTL6_9GENT
MAGGGDHHHVDGSHGHGGGGDFRSKVWSMSGGPYCRPKHWKRNTAIAMAGVFLLCIPIAMISVQLEAEGGHWGCGAQLDEWGSSSFDLPSWGL